MTWEVPADYLKGNVWERDLLDWLQSNHPALCRELGSDLVAYCQARTSQCLATCERLEEAGTPADVATELALAELFPPVPSPVETWELESGINSAEGVASQQLLASNP